MKPGDKAKITKRTFLHQGIFIHSGYPVEIKEVLPNGSYITIYIDKEGNPHDIEFQKDELSAL